MHLKQTIDISSHGRLFTIESNVNFLDLVATSVLDGRLLANNKAATDLFCLTNWTILLPTQRAVRTIRTAFLKAKSEKGAILLPNIRPIAEGDEEATLIFSVADSISNTNDLAIPPAIDKFERHLVLMQLVQRWAKTMASSKNKVVGTSEMTASQITRLAGELADMMDKVEIENLSLDRIFDLVPEDYAVHWQKTVEFLQIIATWWPLYLSASGCISPTERRNRMILAEADRLSRSPPKGPVVIAGVTGSVPATTNLIKTVYGLTNGAIILPGLDKKLTKGDLRDIIANHPEHPQYRLLLLLKELGVQIQDVQSLKHNYAAPLHSNTKMRLISEVLRPAPSTSHWHTLHERFSPKQAQTALDTITYLALPSEQDEAEAIALILRQAAEHPSQSAALVTPNRILARRVGVRLESWCINVDDSAGRPFSQTMLGTFLELVINAVACNYEPCAIMALLKHPLCRLKRTASSIRRVSHALEIAVLRTSYFGHGLDGLEQSLEKTAQNMLNSHQQRHAIFRLEYQDWNESFELIQDLRQAYTPLTLLFARPNISPLQAFTSAHLQTAEYLAAKPLKADANSKKNTSELWLGEAGKVGARIFAGLLNSELPECNITCLDYPEIYRALIKKETVNSCASPHPRIFIWGPYEARLQRPDVIILGSLNEGIWPKTMDPNPWLSRTMLSDIGLPTPEEKIGYAAHDFSQLLCVDKVYLTRAEMSNGAPTVPSRWLMRLQAVRASLEIKTPHSAQPPWLEWVRLRNAAKPSVPIKRPAPKPLLSLRPRELSVSDVETWIANPYAIFARHILKLEALPRLGADPDASLKGTIIHKILGIYLKKFPTQPPTDIAQELDVIARRLFHEFRSNPRIATFWIERFRRFATWFVYEDVRLRGDSKKSLSEISGAVVINTPGGPFTLKARADRIDLSIDYLVISDYKTASNLTNLTARAKAGYSPQLLLEALIAKHGGFSGLRAAPVSKLRYISAAGGDPAGAINELKIENIQAAILDTEHELTALIRHFDNVNTPYLATRRPQFHYDYDVYAHLARISEWLGENDKVGAE
ncbi:MAG: double-strand break repair protein AddB [Hyphomicrobiaceae bacterium]|nr:double-strand break repair protein AddB [Hyphomicrobiaceae bacterium]